MSPLLLPFPDAEALCARELRTAAVTGGRVYSSIPASPTWPLTTVSRLGGVPAIREKLDAPRIQVEVWGTSKSEARDQADFARLTLHNMAGRSFVDIGAASAYVTAVEDETGLMWLPDPDTKRDRYLFSVRVYLHTDLVT